MALPEDLIKEIERLGENVATFEWIANSEGLDFARTFAASIARTARLFEKWFPRLEDFHEQQCKVRVDKTDSRIAESINRILLPKIVDAERVPQRNSFTATIFTAPFCAHEILKENWPGDYPNSVILTPEETERWHKIYDEQSDDWWFTFQDWDVTVNPPGDSFWLEHCEYSVPPDSQSLLVIWGLQWGSLAGGHQAELWHLPENGLEVLLGSLGDITC